jgi:hypothetical protein
MDAYGWTVVGLWWLWWLCVDWFIGKSARAAPPSLPPPARAAPPPPPRPSSRTEQPDSAAQTEQVRAFRVECRSLQITVGFLYSDCQRRQTRQCGIGSFRSPVCRVRASARADPGTSGYGKWTFCFFLECVSPYPLGSGQIVIYVYA